MYQFETTAENGMTNGSGENGTTGIWLMILLCAAGESSRLSMSNTSSNSNSID